MMIKVVSNLNRKVIISQSSVSIEFLREESNGFVQLDYDLNFPVTGDEYVFFPACCYDGNRFEVLKKAYPPMFTPQESHVDMPVTITDVPRLNKNGSGKIEVTAGDLSVPCVGVFSKVQCKAVLLYSIQEIGGHNLGFNYQGGSVSVIYPAKRTDKIYCGSSMQDGRDSGINFTKGEKIEIPYQLVEFSCESMERFFQIFFETRKIMGLDNAYPKSILPPEKQFQIQKDKFNSMNWRENGGFYGVGTTNEPTQVWQPGWVGGGMSSYALMKLGGNLEWQRGISTLRHLFNTQLSSGLLSGIVTENLEMLNDGFEKCGCENYHLIRKSADSLYFIFKHFNLMLEHEESIPPEFIDGAKRLADVFVQIWECYGQFGQFVDAYTAEIKVGGSTSAGIAPAGLVSAYLFFGESKYLEVAKESAESYYTRDASKGYTTGGPGEILQGPDSESAFGLLESYVKLFDVTKEKRWLEYAKHTANLCSSWVVAYNYKFPELSEFSRLEMKTVGSVFANVQNKHAAPGICTLSGNSLFKLFQWTNNKLYLILLEDIAITISQYMSTNERPIFSWDTPKDAFLLDIRSTDTESEKLPQGFICERVNMSDWESKRCVGGVFNGSCWSESSNLLVLAEVAELIGFTPSDFHFT